MRKVVGILVLFILINSCGDTSEEGPSRIYFGEDICERCKMIISEKEFAAQYQLSTGKTVKFDDIGCMFHYLDVEKPEHVKSIYVTDYDSGEWINAENGYFIWTENIRTPMGYGILSVKNINKAKEIETTQKGKYVGRLNAVTDFIINGSEANSN